MTGEVLFFGRLRDVAGVSRQPLPKGSAGVTASVLIALLSEGRPELQDALTDGSVRLCVNQVVCEPGSDPVISENDEVAFLPPMSGG